MNSKFIFLLVFCLNLGCHQNNAQTETQNEERQSLLTTFTQNEYLEDFNQLISLLKENHPQLYEYIAKDAFDALVKEKAASITDQFKIGEFTWLCRSIVSAIGCGHTVVPTIGMNFFLPDELVFPLKVIYIDDKLYVLDPLKNKKQIAIGDEIISINGTPVKAIKEAMHNHISSDAGNRSLKAEYINNGFMEYAAFYFKFVDKYEIDCIKDHEIKTIHLNQLDAYTEERPNSGNCENNLCFEIEEDIDLAIITIRSFYYYREDFATFQAFIDSSFSEIKSKQIQNLIIDLRDNGGGDPYCGSYLLQHFADKPYQYYKTGMGAYQDLQKDIPPNENRFKGKPIILINGRCFSTTGQLSALIKANDFGTFVGRETGATFKCNATVRPFVLTNTGVTPYIATRTYEAAVSTLPKDKGILPHYEVKRSLSDILNDIDVDLAFGKKLLVGDGDE